MTPALVRALVAATVALAPSGEARAGSPREGQRPLNASLRLRPASGPSWVVVPAGPFEMGASDDERTRREAACMAELGPEVPSNCERDRFRTFVPDERIVILSRYKIGRREVTMGEYRACAKAGRCVATPLYGEDAQLLGDEMPIIGVTWYEARAYCRFVGGRLPTEAEWEKAARGIDARPFPWGGEDHLDAANLGRPLSYALAVMPAMYPPYDGDERDGFYALAPPGSYPRGASPYGALDLIGNVSEWVEDGAALTYEKLPYVDPLQVESKDDLRVVRGASWRWPRYMATAYWRHSDRADARSNDRGFRCAKE